MIMPKPNPKTPQKGNVTVTLPRLFSGRMLAGNPPEKFERMDETERLCAQLEFIRDRAYFLANMPYDPSCGLPANVHSEALELSRATSSALSHLSSGEMVNAAAATMKVGEKLSGIDAVLARAKALDVTEQIFRAKSAGGKSTASQKKYQAIQNVKEAAKQWRTLAENGKPEHERVALIAMRMAAKPDTVRRWIKKAGLR